MHVGFIHKHGLEARVRVTARQDLLVELKDLVQVRHGVFEQWQQLRQAEVRHLSGTDTGKKPLLQDPRRDGLPVKAPI